MLKLITYIAAHAQFINLRDDKEGASLAEYALLLGLITAAVVATVAVLSGAIGDVITATSGLIGGGGDAGGEEGG